MLNQKHHQELNDRLDRIEAIVKALKAVYRCQTHSELSRAEADLMDATRSSTLDTPPAK